MVKVYFKNIHIEIINLIESASFDIKICVAWFTDFDIYSKIVEKQKQGIKIEVIVANHEFNKKSRVDFKELLKHNGKISYIGNISDGSKERFMHNKFCIIDSSIIITGSYNWSFKARTNDENIITIANEPEIVKQFTEKFYEIKPNYGFAIRDNKVSLLPIEKIMEKWDNVPIPNKISETTSPNKTQITNKF